jgi:hypothetical protein
MLRQFPVGAQHGNLRHAFVQVHADMYHGFGLLPQRVCAISTCAPSLSHAGQEANALMTSLICTSIGTPDGFRSEWVADLIGIRTSAVARTMKVREVILPLIAG